MFNQPSFDEKDLNSLRRLVTRSRANDTQYSWVRLVDTQSMSPTIKGDISLLIEWTEDYQFQKGEIIVFSKQNTPFLLAHRACKYRIAQDELEILQIADQFTFGNDFGAGWIKAKDVFGRVKKIHFGYLKRAVSLDIKMIQELASWIAELSIQRLSLSHPHTFIQLWAFKITAVGHYLACLLYRLALYFCAYSGLPKEPKRIEATNYNDTCQ